MNVLSIGGSDPSSGAGIQSDIRTFENHGVYGFTVITSITSQNTKKISKILPISPKNIKSQLESVLSDFKIEGDLPVNKISAYLMFPYLAWCCYAFILNLNLYLLN